LGKLVVALTDDEVPGLRRIQERALANGVPALRWVDGGGIAEIEPHAAGVAALHSPHTAVADFPGVAAALAAEIVGRGASLQLGATVAALRDGGDSVRVGLSDGRTQVFDQVVVCAGLGGDGLAAAAGRLGDVRTVPFRGEYFRLVGPARERVRGLIYPVPDPRYPFLGVHLTRTHADEVLAGPNAVLALAREGYRWGDVSRRDLLDFGRWPGTWRMARQHWRTGLYEMGGSVSKRVFTARVQRYLPSLSVSDLEPFAAGVRAQAVDRRGGLVDDFLVEQAGRVVLVRNAPSPAATSSLAIAEHLVGLLASGSVGHHG
jgi:L-2-hydroxyglutarate oxidase LhgO